MAKDEKVVPVWSFWSTKAVWPLTSDAGERWCEDALIRFKPVRSWKAVLGECGLHSQAMELFLESGQCPPGLRRDVARARLAVEYAEVREGKRKRVQRRRKKKAKASETASAGPAAGDGSATESESGGDDADGLFRDMDGSPVDDFDTVLPADLSERARSDDIVPVWRSGLPCQDEMMQFASSLSAAMDAEAAPLVQRDLVTAAWPDVFGANVQQRVLLTDVLWHLHDVHVWATGNRASAMPQLAGLCVGVAGTGKTFIQTFVRMFCSMFTLGQHASVMVAPTGAAARNCNGSTPERALKMAARNAIKFTDPGTSEAVGALQLKYSGTICLLVDEVSMIGRCFMGQLAKSCSYVFGQGNVEEDEVPCWGGLNIVLFFGDFSQIGPVMDPGGMLYSTTAAKNLVASYGALAYSTLTSKYVLTVPVRQDADSDFYRQLNAARSGTADVASAEFWTRRQKLFLPDSERPGFADVETAGLFVLTCTRRDRDAVNATYMRTLRNCCRVNAVATGKHAQQENPAIGMCKNIPLSIVLAIGMVVKLTVNICPEWGLCNGSRGTVVDIIYPGDDGYIPPAAPNSGADTAAVFPIVIVDFPDYTGSRVLLPGHRTYVPIVAMERKCGAKSKCCSRVGLPLVCSASPLHLVFVCACCRLSIVLVWQVCGKADTVHSAQGVTVGRGRALERCLLMWSLAAEHKCPGLFYVGASRAADVAAMALENPLSVKDAQTIGPLLVALAVFAGLHMILCTCFLTQFNAQAMVMLRGLPARRWPLLHSKLRSSN